MDFNDTPEEAAFRAEARAWLEANAEPLDPGEEGGDLLGERVDDEALAAAKAWQKKKADAGWACITWPREYGGREATAIQSVIWNQEHANFRTPPNIFSIGLARSSGASSSASRRRARTSPACAAPRCATATTGS
jgi:alkylation response protein AidB-like acyl-CoA dehydrogenase